MQRLLFKIYKNYLVYLKSVANKFFGQKNMAEDSTILLCKSDKIGDFFLFIPHLISLRDSGYKVVLIGEKFFKEILDYHKIDIIFIEANTQSIKSVKEIISKLKKYRFSYAINFSMNVWGGIFVNHSNSQNKIALVQETEHYTYKGVNLFYDQYYSYKLNTHTFDCYTNIIAELVSGFSVEPETLKLNKSKSNQIVIHPFASWKPREWPYYCEFIKDLSERSSAQINIIGTQNEFNSNSEFQTLTNDKIQLIILDSLTHLMNAINQADMFIGNDSGPAHYASLLGLKTYVLWGPGNYERIHPIGKNTTFLGTNFECSPCRQKGDVCERGSNDCLKSIPIIELMNLVIKDLQELGH